MTIQTSLTTLHVGRRTYDVDADGYCAALRSFIVRSEATGHLMTIPVD